MKKELNTPRFITVGTHPYVTTSITYLPEKMNYSDINKAVENIGINGLNPKINFSNHFGNAEYTQTK